MSTLSNVISSLFSISKPCDDDEFLNLLSLKVKPSPFSITTYFLSVLLTVTSVIVEESVPTKWSTMSESVSTINTLLIDNES